MLLPRFACGFSHHWSVHQRRLWSTASVSEVKIAAIIPARMASRRYPGKPLINIEGLPMIEHVRRRTLMYKGFSDVVVATCDPEISDVVKQFGGEVMMTSSNHIMASDRVAEAAEHLDCTHVVNVQGDEILVNPEDLQRMHKAILTDESLPYWCSTAIVDKKEELAETSIVKCVVSKSGKVFYCSRDLTHLNLENEFDPVKKLLGVFGYRRDSLFAYGQLQRTRLETIQSIDVCRIIEHDIPLQSVPFTSGYPGINDRREEELVKEILKTDSEQKMLLEEVLTWK